MRRRPRARQSEEISFAKLIFVARNRELKADLPAGGTSSRTDSDTEALPSATALGLVPQRGRLVRR